MTLLLSQILYSYGPYRHFQLSFQASGATFVGTVWLRDMHLVVIKLIDLKFQLVHCPFTKYITLLILVYYVCHCNFDFFGNFIFTFPVSFSEIDYYLLISRASHSSNGSLDIFITININFCIQKSNFDIFKSNFAVGCCLLRFFNTLLSVPFHILKI